MRLIGVLNINGSLPTGKFGGRGNLKQPACENISVRYPNPKGQALLTRLAFQKMPLS